MTTHTQSARRHFAPWMTLFAGVCLGVLPLVDARPGLQAWSCLIAGGLFVTSAALVLIMNPTWGLELQGDRLHWWHDGKGLERTLSVTEVRAVHVDRHADVAELEATSGLHVVPRECVSGDAQAWALELHQQYPHIEYHVS